MAGAVSEQLTAASAAALAGISRSAWSAYVARGYAPRPDAYEGRSPRWSKSTVRAWLGSRPGQGARPSTGAVFTAALLEREIGAAGRSRHALAVERRVDHRVVDDAAIRAGLHEPLPPDGAAVLCRWYDEQRLTVRQVADRLGVSPRTAGRLLRIAGASIRGAGRPRR